MFLYRFGLSEPPFSRITDPSFTSWTSGFQRTFEAIRDDVLSGAPAVVLTARAGLGKSMLLSALARDRLVSETKLVVHLQVAAHHRAVLLRTVADTLGERAGLEPSDRTESRDAATEIADLSQAVRQSGRTVLLLLEDLTAKSAEAVLALHDLAADDSSLSLVLVGHPGLQALLDRMSERGFDVRDAHHYQLHPLNADEAMDYVADRLERAGGNAELFSPEAVLLINDAANGVPSAINAIATACLSHAFGERRWTIDRDLVARCLAKTDGRVSADQAGANESASRQGGATLRTVLSDSRRADALRTVAGGRQQTPAPGIRLAVRSAEVTGQSMNSPLPPREHPRTAPAEASNAMRRSAGSGHGDSRAPDARSGQLLQRPVFATRSSKGRSRMPWATAAAVLVAASATIVILLPGFGPSITLDTEPVESVDAPEVMAASETVDTAEPPVLQAIETGDAQDRPLDSEKVAALVSPVSDEQAMISAVVPTSAGPVIEPLKPSSEAEAAAEQFYRAGLFGETPLGSAVAFARGAMRGHHRAALYLGQMFETGDGVSYAPAIAARWYAVADDASPDMFDILTTSKVTPIFASSEDDSIDLVWDGAADKFVVEIGDENRNRLGMLETPLTAIRLPDLDDAAFWRVSDASGDLADWSPITYDKSSP